MKHDRRDKSRPEDLFEHSKRNIYPEHWAILAVLVFCYLIAAFTLIS